MSDDFPPMTHFKFHMILTEKPNIDEITEQYGRFSRIAIDIAEKIYLRTRLAEAQGWRCAYCQKKMFWKKHFKKSAPTIEHYICESNGGETTYDNCIAACAGCNNRRGNKPVDQFMYELSVEKQGWSVQVWDNGKEVFLLNDGTWGERGNKNIRRYSGTGRAKSILRDLKHFTKAKLVSLPF